MPQELDSPAGAEAAHGVPPIFLSVGQPRNGSSVSGSFLVVEGIAFASAGLLEVTVEIGALRRKARHGIRREDVAIAFPKIPALANAGFFCRLFHNSVVEASKGPAGRQLLTVTARSRDGHEVKRDVELKLGIADEVADQAGVTREATALVQSPRRIAPRKENETVEFYCDSAVMSSLGELSLSGWAVAAAGVTRIGVLFEGESLGDVDYGHERPDVGNKFPLIAASRHPGFSFNAACR